MKQQVIAVDFDDVLMPFNAGLCAYHNRFHCTAIEYNDIYSFEMEQVYGCTRELMLERLVAFYQSPDHWALKPLPDTVAAINYLCKHYKLEIITSRPDTLRKQTHAWVERYFPNSFHEIHFTNGIAAEEGALRRHKSEVCTEIGAIVLIEDALKHAEDVASNGTTVLLHDRPWNQGHTPANVVRVTSWNDIIWWIDDCAYV